MLLLFCLCVAARLVYHHNYGFPSGVALAVLLLNLARIHPTATSSDLFRLFFVHYGGLWESQYPDLAPMHLNESLNPYPQHYRRWAGLPDTWEAVPNQRDAFVVLTPSYPHVNSCHTMSFTSMRLFVAEVCRARDLFTTSVPPTCQHPWRLAIQPPTWVTTFDAVVHVTVASTSQENFGLLAGFVESKIKYLWYCLEGAGIDAFLYPGKITAPCCVAETSMEGGPSVTFVCGVRNGGASSKQLNAAVMRALEEFAYFIEIPPETAAKVPGAQPLRARFSNSSSGRRHAQVFDTLIQAMLGNVLTPSSGPAKRGRAET